MKRTRRGWTAGLAMLGCVAALPAHGLNRHLDWHKRVTQGPKMDITAATFFGAAGVEEFVGVAADPEGRIVAYGNSWGPPFPDTVAPRVIGIDQLWNVPLYVPGTEVDRKGRPQPPPATNPNRTGFLVFYSRDLTQVQEIVRFGWGVASITAGCVMRDGRVVIAGAATRNFRRVAEGADAMHVQPRGEGDAFGPVEYEGVIGPGDVYVAGLSRDLKKLEWVWILEGHRHGPTRMYEGAEGEAVFECLGIHAISADGARLRHIMPWGGSHQRRMFLGVSPVDGTLMTGGDEHMHTGREPWRRPKLRLFAPDGSLQTRLYDWHGPLVGHDGFRLVSDTAIRGGTFLPNGHAFVYAWSDGGNSVMTRNPVDLEKPVASQGLGMSAWGANVSSFCHFARFDPHNYDDASYTFWAAYMQTKPNGLRVSFMGGTPGGRIMVTGSSASWLVQSTTRWFRSAHHYNQITRGLDTVGTALLPNGWPDYLGVGGNGEFSAVFTPDFKTVLWSSALAEIEHAAMAACPAGIAAASVARGFDRGDGRSPLFEEHDVADWPGFLAALRAAGAADADSPGKRLWDALQPGTQAAVRAVGDDRAPDATVRELIFADLNERLKTPGLYARALWPQLPTDRIETTYLTWLAGDGLPDTYVADFNRRLVEHAFPDHVFRAPKSNWTPILAAAQPTFGGGYSDGHIYLLRDVED